MTLGHERIPNLGVSHIDDAHGDICRRRALLLVAVRAGHDAAAFAELEELVVRLGLHFQDEERWMQAVDYPNRAAHARAHAVGLEGLRHAMAAFAPDGPDARFADAVERVAGWIEVHLQAEDLTLGRFLEAQRPPPPALRRGG
jgi:hemerythrin-like metal-binding protein